MKKFFLFLFTIHSFVSFSQEIGVCNLDTTKYQLVPCNNGEYSASVDPTYLQSFEPIVFNIFFWGINKDSSLNEPTITEESVLQNVAKINKEYNQFNIFFKYIGFDNTSFNSDDHYVGATLLQIYSYARSNGYFLSNSFNVYVPGALNQGGGEAFRPGRVLAVNKSGFNAYSHTILHELGHNLGLYHTEDDYLNNCERVTRNSGEIIYNADVAGDCVVDTAAKPRFLLGDIDGSVIVDLDLENCLYIGDGNDCGGTPYQINEEDVRNYMSKGVAPYPASGCHDQFSIGQMIRMWETIEIDANQIPSNQKIVPAKTSIASLYEPYQGEYGNSNELNLPLFQPGFDYKFIECCCDYPLPSDYEDISFSFNPDNVLASFDADETNFSSIIHPNHSAIRILQLEDNTSPIFQPRRCYDNLNLSPMIPIGGYITKFNDGVFNTNVTIVYKSAEEINNPNLITELKKGLYRIVKKYSDGSVDEKVVLIK